MSTATQKLTREEWLLKAIDLLRPDFENLSEACSENYRIPKVVRVSVGFPSRRGLAKRKTAIGECWHGSITKDGAPHLFISPLLGGKIDPVSGGVLVTLVHELCHAVVASDAGHGARFQKAWSAVGFEGSPTNDKASDALKKRLNAILREIGKYPHEKLVPPVGQDKKQGTRLIKLICACDEPRIIRATRKAIEAGLRGDTGIRCLVCKEDFCEEGEDE